MSPVTGQAKIKDYEAVVGPQVVEELHLLARSLGRRRILHVNSTRVGGGVAEMLQRVVPLLCELGIDARWEVIEGSQRFFDITKAFHNALQGEPTEVTPEMLDFYLACNRENARRVALEADLVVIHDPQPAAMVLSRGSGKRWIWRCHIDLSSPDPVLWRYLQKYVERFDASVFSMAKFAQKLSIPQFIIPPSIDPLSDKNRELSPEEMERALDKLQIPRDRPIITQVSRFDRFKDPTGVIDAFKLVRKHVECRLVMAGGGATDDPEGPSVMAAAREKAQGDPDIIIIELPPFSDIAVNAIQRAASVIVQKSLKEGFGLTVTEGLWKGKPVVGGAAGGITLQIQDNFNGYLVHSVEGTAYRLRYLLSRPDLIKRLGETGREFVRLNFLITRTLRDHLLVALALDHPGRGSITLGSK